MSIHKSLLVGSKLKRHRNVLTRYERIDMLKKDGRWTEENSIFGLPKVQAGMKIKKSKGGEKKKKE